MALHTFLCKSCRVVGLKQNALKESCLNLYSNALPFVTLTKLQHFGEEQPYMLLLLYYFLWLCSPARAMASSSHEVP
jgi:hypothetical protein